MHAAQISIVRVITLEYDIETVKLDGTSHKVKISGLDGTVIKDESDK